MATRPEFKTAMEAFEKLTLAELSEIRTYVTWQVQQMKIQKSAAVAKIVKENNPDINYFEIEDESIKIRREIK